MALARPTARKRKDAWIVFAFLIVVQIICFRGSQKLHANTFSRSTPSVAAKLSLDHDPSSYRVWKRSLIDRTLSILPNFDVGQDGSVLGGDKRKQPSQHEKKTNDYVEHARHTSSASHHSRHTSTHKNHSTTSTSKTTTAPTSVSITSTSRAHKPTSLPQEPGKEPSTPCQPIPVDIAPIDTCNHVIQYCPASGHFDYLRFYYCAGVSDSQDPPENPGKHQPRWHIGLSLLRVIRLVLILAWMLFLFSWVGVVASDYFCPNLSTIASRLGLNESTAGVTFLAFGNGSPDVFSTFGAMKSDSGTLAIGELIGAASFIVSVISGSMMLIAPFRVKPWPFCRDVGFFTVAVMLTLTFLFDGKLKRSETIALICLYVLYATTVIVGSWWHERQRHKRLMIAAARDEYDSNSDAHSIARSVSRTSIRSHNPENGDLERSQLLSIPATTSSQRLHSPSEYDPDFDPFEDWARQRDALDATNPTRASTPEPTGSNGHVTPLQTPGSTASRAAIKSSLNVRPNFVPRHSLLSAIEFRDVVQSLKKDASADRSQAVFQSWDPESFLPHHHHLHHRRQRSIGSGRPSRDNESDGSPRLPHLSGHSRVLSLGPGVVGSPSMVRGSSIPSRDRRRTLGSEDSQAPGFDRTNHSPNLSQGTPASISVGNVDDPWREHLPGDACEPLGSPALPLDGSNRSDPLHQHDAMLKSLPKLEIPKWDTKASRSQATRDGVDSRKLSSMPSIKVTSTSPGGTTSHLRAHGLVAPPRIRPKRSLGELVAWKIQVVFRALFPSLRHLHAKSWLGVIVSFLTSPAILMLNLTLPVVDESAEEEQDDDEADGVGAVRLEGEEAEIRAAGRNNNDEGDEEERILDLGSATTHSTQLSAAERMEAVEHAIREDNTHRDREIASALRRLPQSGGSPLSLGGNTHHGAIRLPITESPAQQDAPPHSAPVSAISKPESCTWEEEAEEQEQRRSSNRFLVLIQCIFAPTFVTWAIASESGTPHLAYKVMFAGLIGFVAACLVFWLMRRKDTGKVRYSDRMLAIMAMLRCSMGFVVSVMWIMTIVDEVVSILQTVGLIVGLSDAILGLTVFAMGNSLGDLVANVTIARLGHPVMAISACFAGPMLNLLLGIGISGTWLLSGPTSHQPWSHSNADGIYPIDFSPTLLVSGLGLLLILIGTLIAVPMNNFHLTRPIGLSLIGTYVVIMTLNLLTEIFWVR